jgi:hypothetical protein
VLCTIALIQASLQAALQTDIQVTVRAKPTGFSTAL